MYRIINSESNPFIFIFNFDLNIFRLLDFVKNNYIFFELQIKQEVKRKLSK